MVAHALGLTGHEHLDGPRAVGVAAQETLALQRRQLVGDAARAGQADRDADLAHARRVARAARRCPGSPRAPGAAVRSGRRRRRVAVLLHDHLVAGAPALDLDGRGLGLRRPLGRRLPGRRSCGGRGLRWPSRRLLSWPWWPPSLAAWPVSAPCRCLLSAARWSGRLGAGPAGSSCWPPVRCRWSLLGLTHERNGTGGGTAASRPSVPTLGAHRTRFVQQFQTCVRRVSRRMSAGCVRTRTGVRSNGSFDPFPGGQHDRSDIDPRARPPGRL